MGVTPLACVSLPIVAHLHDWEPTAGAHSWSRVFLCITIVFAATNSVYPVFFSEMFNVRYRVGGMAVGLRLGLVLTGFSPTIIQAIKAANNNAWGPAAAYTTVACLISAVTS